MNKSNFSSLSIIALAFLTLCSLVWFSTKERYSGGLVEAISSFSLPQVPPIFATEKENNQPLGIQVLEETVEKTVVEVPKKKNAEIVSAEASDLIEVDKIKKEAVEAVNTKIAEIVPAVATAAPDSKDHSLETETDLSLQTNEPIIVVHSDEKLIEIPTTRKGKILAVNFSFNKAQLTPQSSSVLNELARRLHIDTRIQLMINGYTDTTGDLQANLRLSQNRAEAVKSYLTGRGISPSRIQANGYGSASPIADNTSIAGRLKNRRIEIIEDIKP